MIVDFRKSSPCPALTYIQGSEISLLDNYKYLGIVIDSKLCFESHVDFVYKKAQRLYFLRKMDSFNVCGSMMTIQDVLLQFHSICFVFLHCGVVWEPQPVQQK